MSLIAGIDFSSHQIDIVTLDENTNHATHHTYTLDTPGSDAFTRARQVRHAMPTTTFWDDTLAIGIEDPRGMSRRSDSVLYRIQGAILASIPPILLVQDWKPSSWRKQLGIAQTGKQAPAEFALNHWQDPPGVVSQDACDAYCIAYATRQRIVIEEAA